MKLKENGKVKGDRYWPKKSGPHYAKQYGSFIVEQETSVTVEDQVNIDTSESRVLIFNLLNSSR